MEEIRLRRAPAGRAVRLERARVATGELAQRAFPAAAANRVERGRRESLAFLRPRHELQHRGEDGARQREVPLPRGKWIDFWSGERIDGGGTVPSTASIETIPVFVRAGSILPTYRVTDVERGLGDGAESERPLELTLWGRPPLGHAALRLADGTRVRWRAGEWELSRKREAVFNEIR